MQRATLQSVGVDAFARRMTVGIPAASLLYASIKKERPSEDGRPSFYQTDSISR
jgi:hypothetical protein